MVLKPSPDLQRWSVTSLFVVPGAPTVVRARACGSVWIYGVCVYVRTGTDSVYPMGRGCGKGLCGYRMGRLSDHHRHHQRRRRRRWWVLSLTCVCVSAALFVRLLVEDIYMSIVFVDAMHKYSILGKLRVRRYRVQIMMQESTSAWFEDNQK